MTARTSILDDADAVAISLAGQILGVARTRPAVGIMLAGDPALAAAYALVAGASSVDFAGIHLWYADERMVAASHPDSRHGVLARAGLAESRATVHRIPGELGAITAARRAASELHAHAGADAALDLVVLGLGTDGHTAALFPGDPALAATGAFFPARGGTRVTATLALLARARHVVFAVTGHERAAICARILRAPPTPDLPASLVAAAAADVTWVLDRAAAAALG